MTNPNLMSLSELARGFAYERTASCYQMLSRIKVKSQVRAPGSAGESLYDPVKVILALAARPDPRPRTLDTRLGLSDDHARMIVEAMHGVILDGTWAEDTASHLSAEIADSYADDEDGPDQARADLAKQVAGWPDPRAFTAALAAHAAIRLVRDGTPLPKAMQEVGLVVTP